LHEKKALRLCSKLNETRAAPRRAFGGRDRAAAGLAFSLPLNAAKTLAIEAATSAPTAKSSSFSEARQTPPITGMRQSHLASEMDLP